MGSRREMGFLHQMIHQAGFLARIRWRDRRQKWLECLSVAFVQKASFSAITSWLRRRRKKAIGREEIQLVNQAMRFQVEELEVIAEARVQIVKAVGLRQTGNQLRPA